LFRPLQAIHLMTVGPQLVAEEVTQFGVVINEQDFGQG
jgi:hypothetical protein